MNLARPFVLRAMAFAGLLFAGLGLAPTPAGHAELGRAPLVIEVLDVGQGDSIFIRSPEGKTALIDAGPTRTRAAELLRARRVDHVDLAVVSHHHSDHYGGMEEVVKRYHPRYFLASDSGHSTRLFLKLLKTIEAEEITVIRPLDHPRRIELGSVRLTVFPATSEDRRDENNNSIGIRLDYGDFSMLLTGDSETPERAQWLRTDAALAARCTILKLAHHGSRNGLDPRWLALVRPELAIASVGRGNDYGHPHPETVSLLARSNVPLARTDLLGTIVIESDGKNWRLVEPRVDARGKPRQASLDEAAAARTETASRARERTLR